MKYFFIDDSVKTVGGTSLTLDAIIEPNADNVEFIPTSELKFKDCVENKGIWILGNITALNDASATNIIWLLNNRPCVKIEFDYGYCPYRSPNSCIYFTKETCSCFREESQVPVLTHIYKLITERCLHIFYMSQAQMDLHISFTQEGAAPRSVLSSCFTSATFNKILKLREKPKNDKYAILEGQGGWHSKAKGFEQAIQFAKRNNIRTDIIKTETHDEMLQLLSNYKGLIFLPIIQDTCPRIIIEAKLLNLQIFMNGHCQHTKESWWKQKHPIDIADYLMGRPKYFWDTMENISQTI